MASQDDVVTKVLHSIMEVVDALVELYLGKVIAPFLKLHERFYSRLNAVLRGLLDDHAVPTWFTANFITYARTVVVIPTILLLACGHTVLPSILVLLVDFGDFLDGVVARYWVDTKKQRQVEMEKVVSKKNEEAAASKKSKDPASSDDESYEVVTTGSARVIPSWCASHRAKQYGGFVDAVCDKAFVVPCWIFLMSSVPSSSSLNMVQYLVLWCLILAESSSATIRFRAYFLSGGVSAPKVQGLDFSTSAVKADHIGKAKQTFEMVGTTLYILPSLPKYIGLAFLTAAVPLAYESVRRKVKKRTMYVSTGGGKTVFNHSTLKLWMQVKSMGSKLIIGINDKNEKEMVLNACAASSVDQVIVEAPPKVDLMFLEKYGIDYVVATSGQEGLVTQELVAAKRCLMLKGEIAQPLKAKEDLHKD